jgi:hypothetical protein
LTPSASLTKDAWDARQVRAAYKERENSMSKPVVWNSTLALTGLGALLIYILACTSFSPDDSKVLYVTWDAKSGLTAVTVYDRKARKSELLFEPSTQDVKKLATEPATLRPQWINDGHDFLTAWLAGSDSDKSLNLAVLPFDRRGPARTFLLSDLGDEGASGFYYWPLPVVGSSLFLSGKSNSIIRLDLRTGAMYCQTNQQELRLLPSPDNDRLFYLAGTQDPNGPDECGLVNPETFARTPLFQIKDKKISGLSLALSRDAKRLAYQAEDEKPLMVHLLETGRPARTLSLASLGEKMGVTLRHFSPKGDILYGSFTNSADGTATACGFVEIPLDGSPIRKTTLISDVGSGAKDMLGAFQIDISHDGKTLAVESFWLACGDHPLKAEDCALFLVDLTDPQRKVTKVPIPLPPEPPFK